LASGLATPNQHVIREVSSMNTGKHSAGFDQTGADGSRISEQSIRERAYEIYVQRGCKGGHAEGDWLTAEAELKELTKKAADMLSAIKALTGQ